MISRNSFNERPNFRRNPRQDWSVKRSRSTDTESRPGRNQRLRKAVRCPVFISGECYRFWAPLDGDLFMYAHKQTRERWRKEQARFDRCVARYEDETRRRRRRRWRVNASYTEQHTEQHTESPTFRICSETSAEIRGRAR